MTNKSHGKWADYDPLPEESYQYNKPVIYPGTRRRRIRLDKIMDEVRTNSLESAKSPHTPRATCEACGRTFDMTYVKLCYVGPFDNALVCNDCRYKYRYQVMD